MQKSLNLIIKSQILPETSFLEWRNKPVPDKKWANFKAHFSKEVRNYKKTKISQKNHHILQQMQLIKPYLKLKTSSVTSRNHSSTSSGIQLLRQPIKSPHVNPVHQKIMHYQQLIMQIHMNLSKNLEMKIKNLKKN